MLQVILGILVVQMVFVGIGGSYMLYRQGWLVLPDRLRPVNHSGASAVRRRRARKVDQFALCRINRIAWHHQRRFATEMKRETKREMINLTEVRPAHDPQMLALAQLVKAKLVTQTAGLQTLYDVRPGDNAAYQKRVQEFRAALAYVNLHGTAAATAQRSTAEPTRANAA